MTPHPRVARVLAWTRCGICGGRRTVITAGPISATYCRRCDGPEPKR